MDMEKLNENDLEKAAGGSADLIARLISELQKESYALSAVTPKEASSVLYKIWELKVVRHYSKEEVIAEVTESLRPVQRLAMIDLIEQYWDRLY